MAKKRKELNQEQVGDYRHEEARRQHIPLAGIAPTYEVRERKATCYTYDPHLDPPSLPGREGGMRFRDPFEYHIYKRLAPQLTPRPA